MESALQEINGDHSEPDSREGTPLTRPHLLLILNRIGNSSYDDLGLYTAFTLVFAAFLKVGEFTYRQTDLDSGPVFRNWLLTKSSIRFIAGGAHSELTIPSSKTDPSRNGVHLTIAACNDGARPVTPMKNLTRIDSHRPIDAPLFCIGPCDQCQFTREYVVQWLRELPIGVGLGYGAWNGHSFTRGAVTWGAEMGIVDNQIQIFGCRGQTLTKSTSSTLGRNLSHYDDGSSKQD